MAAYSPNGSPIVGTLESVPGVASIRLDSFTRCKDGTLQYEHAGGTDIDWEGQETVTRDGKAVFVDADGNEWTAEQIIIKADVEEE